MAAWKRSLTDYFAYLAVRGVVAILQVLPEENATRLCRAGAWLLSGPLPVRRKTLRENLERIFPRATPAERDALTRAMWYHLLMMVCEIAWAPRRIHRCCWKRYITFADAQAMLRPLLSRRPTVLVTGHLGNFELGGYITGLMGISTSTIARPLDNPFLHDFVADFRGAKGQRLLDKNGCASEVDRHLADGGTLSLLADQHAGNKGCWTDFLGVEASCHKALALFTLAADAPMVVAYTLRAGGPMRFELGTTGVADPRRGGTECGGVRPLTEWYNKRLAEVIARCPEQYWWVHRRWREKPVRRRPGAARAA
jgi:KDO2-lipid IV(A) lauroyltransferase